MKKYIKSLASAAMLASVAVGTANAYDIDLTGLGYVQYGDGQSYSMPIANYQYDYSTNNGPFAISSTPGQISNLVVLNTGSEGGPVTTNYDAQDDAYRTPTGVSGDTWFTASSDTYRGTEGTINANDYDANTPLGVGAQTWDTSLSALETFTAGEDLVFFFNNNQTNSGSTADQTLAAWARLWITDANGNVLSDSTFEFTNNDKPYAIVTQGGGGTFNGDVTGYTATGDGYSNPDHTDLNNTDWVVSGGQLCVATGGVLPVPVPVACGSDPALVGGTDISAAIDHNLGADHVAYAVLFPELNDLLASLYADGNLDMSLYTLHVDVRYGCEGGIGSGWMDCIDTDGFQDGDLLWGNALNNGYEQLFIGTALVGDCPEDDPLCNPTVPEPASVLLLGLGLFGLTYYRRKQLLSRS